MVGCDQRRETHQRKSWWTIANDEIVSVSKRFQGVMQGTLLIGRFPLPLVRQVERCHGIASGDDVDVFEPGSAKKRGSRDLRSGVSSRIQKPETDLPDVRVSGSLRRMERQTDTTPDTGSSGDAIGTAHDEWGSELLGYRWPATRLNRQDMRSLKLASLQVGRPITQLIKEAVQAYAHTLAREAAVCSAIKQIEAAEGGESSQAKDVDSSQRAESPNP
ncbi:MAG: hypothetical protein WEB58_02955 [Planctomycetaceae bacterium]